MSDALTKLDFGVPTNDIKVVTVFGKVALYKNATVHHADGFVIVGTQDEIVHYNRDVVSGIIIKPSEETE